MQDRALAGSLALVGFAATLMLGGCPGGPADSAASGTSAAQRLTLVHAGVDFSAGTTGDAMASADDSDGFTTTWPPPPNNWYFSGTEVWFAPAVNTDDTNYLKDMGNVSLSSVTSAPQSWDGGQGLDLPPLQVGHVYVVKCRDGYAKFLVLAIRTDPHWEADVEYVFSSDSLFTN